MYAEELGRLLVDAVQIMLGAWPSTRSHVIIGEDYFQLFPGSDGVRARLVNQFMAVGVSMMGR